MATSLLHLQTWYLLSHGSWDIQFWKQTISQLTFHWPTRQNDGEPCTTQDARNLKFDLSVALGHILWRTTSENRNFWFGRPSWGQKKRKLAKKACLQLCLLLELIPFRGLLKAHIVLYIGIETWPVSHLCFRLDYVLRRTCNIRYLFYLSIEVWIAD